MMQDGRSFSLLLQVKFMKKRQSGEREFSFTDKDFRFLSILVNQRTGIQLPLHKRDMVYSRLVRRLRALDLKGFKEYCDLLESEHGVAEIGHCINAVTTNLTSFFREAHHFDHLYQEITKRAVHPSRRKRLRIWSCASSSGPEPYSIAMVVRKSMERLVDWDVKILATDIDTNMLVTASVGQYPEDMIEKIPPQYKPYIASAGRNSGNVQMLPVLQDLIAFKPLNLLEKWPMKGPFEFIFCRNVVIYFDKPTQRQLFDRIADIMAPDGFLYIGHSENLFNVSDRFKSVGRTIYQRIK